MQPSPPRLRTRCIVFAVLASCWFLGGCQSVPTHIAAPKISNRAGTLEERGREIYVSFFKCNLCHRPKPVYDYGVESWTEDILPVMGKKAKLSDEEYQAVLAYVTSPEAQTAPATRD